MLLPLAMPFISGLIPCRRYDFLSQLYTYPTYTCIIAYSAGYDYDTVSLSLLLHSSQPLPNT